MKKAQSTTITPRDEDFEADEPRERPEDLEISALDFEQLLVAPSDWTVGSILNQIGKQIDLNPEFQRRGVWSVRAKSSFIESLLLGIPIPQVLLAAKKDNRNSFIVLDGKQRLLTIKQFHDGELEDGAVFSLKGLRVLKSLEGRTWKELSVEREWADKFLNMTQRTAVLRGWQREDVLYEIFHRLNSGSVKLSPMELRMSLYPGPFLKFIIAWSEQLGSMHELLNLNHPDKRMADVELAIRHLAFGDPRLIYDGNLKTFLDRACQQLNEDFSTPKGRTDIENKIKDMEDGIAVVISVFGRNGVCRKWKGGKYERVFNRAIFDIQVGSLSLKSVRAKVLKAPEKFERAFRELSEGDGEFVRALETTTKSVAAVSKRFSAWYAMVEREYKVNLSTPKTVGDDNAATD